MIIRRFFIRSTSLYLSLIALLVAASLPAYSSLANPGLLVSTQRGVPAAHAGVLQSGTRSSHVTVKNGTVQHNRVIAFLSKFDALRPTFPIITILRKSTVVVPSFLDYACNSFCKDYLHSLLPQKKPEDDYLIVV